VTGTARPDLLPEHRRLVLAILTANLPVGASVWVFGSRAIGRARRYSDLDLAIDAGQQLTLDKTARLREAFSDSDLPYRVDLVDWRAIGDRFRQTITADRVRLTGTASTDNAV
jgi:predicted nucleotidyltransferase